MAYIRVAGSRPLNLRRQGGQDGLDIAAGLEAEERAAIVEKIEFDIAAAADELLLAVGFSPVERHVSANDRRIDVAECAADILHESKVGVPVAGIEIVEEDAADAARLVAMREEEIIIAPFLVFGIVGDRMRFAGAAHRAVEGETVGIVLPPPAFEQRGKVGAAAEP